MLIGMGIGIAAEIVARAFSLWMYHQPQTPILNIVAVYGVIMGGLASLVPQIGLAAAAAAGALVGLLYEVANLRALTWWYFPNERMAFIRGHTAIVAVLTLLWAAVPVTIAVAQTALPHPKHEKRTPALNGQSRLDDLNTREKQLIEKLEALQQRERDVQRRLDEVRQRKQALLDKQAVRVHGAPAPSPTPES